MIEPMRTKPIKYYNIMMNFTTIPSYIDCLSKEANLKEVIVKMKMGHFNEAIDELITKFQPIIGKAATPILKNWMMAKTEERERQIVDEYSAILINQAIVMGCTIFDTYLVNCMKVITTREPRIIEELYCENDIAYAEVIESVDYTKLFRIIRRKVLDRFDYGGIKDKIKTMKRIGIDIERALEFKYQTEKAQKKHPNGHCYLFGLYKIRNDIVHRGMLPIRTVEELDKMQTFIFDLMLNLAMAIYEKFKIYADFQMILPDAQSAAVRAKGEDV